MERTASLSLKSRIIDKQSTITQVLWIAVFTVLTAIGAQIEIPHQPVPYTLQTFFVLLAGALLGARNGTVSQILYLAIGVLGLPVFSGAGGGVLRLIGPTGGYLLSFPVAAFVVGYLVQHRSNFFRCVVAMATGLFIVFSLGTIHLNLVYFHNWLDAIVNGFLIFSWWDAVKLVAAASIASTINKKRKRISIE